MSLDCKVCARPRDPDVGISINRNRMRDLQISIAGGCLKCQVIVDAIEAFAPGWMKEKVRDSEEIEITSEKLGFSFEVALRDGRKDVIEVALPREVDPQIGLGPLSEIDVNNNELTRSLAIININDIKDSSQAFEGNSHDIFKSMQIRKEVVADTSSAEAFVSLSRWLAECERKHPQCGNIDLDFVPSRLIDVGFGGSREPFLVEIKGRAIKYATLSYCWGKTEGTLMTEKKNFNTHCSVVSLTSMPRTVADAIVVCRNLGLQYLWVDRLCIIQDDFSDWRRECGQMSQIYSNSYLTIAAAHPKDCEEGFLGKQAFARETKRIPFRSLERDLLARAPLYYSVLGRKFPLATRGWVLQETVLPSRIIYYTGVEMIWECRMLHQCECLHLQNTNTTFNCAMARWSGSQSLDGANNGQLHSLWGKIVSEYSTRMFSNESDRLVAISGVARKLMEHMTSTGGQKPKYLAGLWQHNLPWALLWSVKSGYRALVHQPLEYVAPSWSWASLGLPVLYPGAPMDTTFQNRIVISDAQTTALDEFGAVTAGHITLTGFITPVNLYVIYRSEHRAYGIYDDVLHYYVGFPGHCRQEFECDAFAGLTHDELTPGYPCSKKCVCGKCAIDLNTAQYYCLRVGSTSRKLKWWNKVASTEYGLILRKSWTVHSAFDRIGRFMWSGDEFAESGLEENATKAIVLLV